MLRVALADDDELLRRSLSMLLERCGFKVVISASDGLELLSRLAQTAVECIITDFHMGYGGPILLSTLRHAYPDLPVYVLSGGLTQDEGKSLTGIRRYYQKGRFSLPEIRQIYEELEAFHSQ